jgi:O-6-methylguanine DNA methyltransferase
MRPAKTSLTWLGIATSDGEFRAGYSDSGLAELHFPLQHGDAGTSAGKKVAPTIRRWQQTTAAALKRILAGRPAGKLPPLDGSAGTDFQQQVWAVMKRIPTGATRSYGEIARAIGKPKAVRAVGGACAANPVPVIVPCHRVLAANGKIGGFSGGPGWKAKLLAREGVTPAC